MGGVKLRTKYNAPSDIKREKSKSNSPDSGERRKKRKDKKARSATKRITLATKTAKLS